MEQRDLIARVNELQDLFNGVGGESVDLPQIVTVGAQSSGKSSVLENIVGRDFLPRGSGIVTRRPLVLQLIHLPPSSQPSAPNQTSDSNAGPSAPLGARKQVREYAEFLHMPNQRFHDFNEVRKEIENETRRVTGANKGISKLPINLKLYSENVTNLTLVDLPGLTKIPVGDQPTDIERQIRSLVLEYITKPNCVILAISPANVDIANSDSLKLARQVDPEGRRTLGVLSKLDLMDNGTNAIDILTGRTYPLKLGFIGVVNRSQQDINEEKPMEEALQAESDFFHSHPAYRLIAHRCGTRYLAKTLNTVLLNHIRDKLPDLKARLNTLIGQTQQELASYGDVAFMGEQHRGSLVLNLMNKFSRDFVASIEGAQPEQSTKELVGGARILQIFELKYGRALESINPMHNLSATEIGIAIRNSTGARPSLFMPDKAFEMLVRPQIRLLEPSSLRCVDLVYEELMKFCHSCTSTELARYPRLQAQIIEVVSDLLRERLGPTIESVKSLIQIQIAYINTKHPLFQNMTQSFILQHEEQNRRNAIAERKAESDLRSNEGSGDEGEPNIMFPDAKVNGRASSSDDRLHKQQRASSSSHLERGHTGARHVSSSSVSGRPVSPIGFGSSTAHSSQNQVKETFLNYFFGSQPGPVGPTTGRRGPLPDLSESRADNPLSGRKGLEGSAAAFDMKSLETHLDASSLDDDSLGLTEWEKSTVPFIQSMITSYFSIVRQTIQDLVPKAIMHYLVNETCETVQNRLVRVLYKESLFDELLQEDENTMADRNRVKTTLDAYKEAFKKLSDYP